MPPTFDELVTTHAAAIAEEINARGRMHVVTFEILTAQTPARLRVYHKVVGGTAIRIFDEGFSARADDRKLTHYRFFNRFSPALKRHVMQRISFADVRDFFCIQIVIENWRPVGDLA